MCVYAVVCPYTFFHLLLLILFSSTNIFFHIYQQLRYNYWEKNLGIKGISYMYLHMYSWKWNKTKSKIVLRKKQKGKIVYQKERKNDRKVSIIYVKRQYLKLNRHSSTLRVDRSVLEELICWWLSDWSCKMTWWNHISYI